MKSMTILLAGFLITPISRAELKSSASDGFQVQITKGISLKHDAAYQMFVDDFNQWYDAQHSYSGKAKNLSLNLKQRCMLETMPNGGFVRHMEIVFHQPGRILRMTGGLGPLQELGVTGALTVRFQPESDNSAQLVVSYNVSGRKSLQLDKIAPAVDQVLSGQFERFARHCRGNLTPEQPSTPD